MSSRMPPGRRATSCSRSCSWCVPGSGSCRSRSVSPPDTAWVPGPPSAGGRGGLCGRRRCRDRGAGVGHWSSWRGHGSLDGHGHGGCGAPRGASTEGRGEYWSSALDANATAPLTGIGPGTFEYWWARNSIPGFNFIRDAHSLYMETLAELGIIGFTLIALTMGAVLAAGLRRVHGAPERRSQLAGAVASCVAFVVFAGIDWVWELPVLPIAFLLLAAALLGGWTASAAKAREGGAIGTSPSVPRPRRAVFGSASPDWRSSTIVIGIPLASVEAIRSSEERLASGDLNSALDAAERAESLQPYAATPKVQQAVVLERSGDLTGAAAAARDATTREATNWRTWLLLANIEAKRQQATAALDAYDEAHRLNPRSLVFQETTREEFASRLGE